MPRREQYTEVRKTNQIRAAHVQGMGDVLFKGFQCLNSECQNFIFVRQDEIPSDFAIVCPECGFVLRGGDETKFYDYELIDERDGHVVQAGEFIVSHDEYLNEAQLYKYCIICNTLKPIDFFSDHSSRRSGKQGECRMCKTLYNSIKNQTRLTDQHREAAMRRRLYNILSGEPGKIDSRMVFDRFNGKCFACQKDLTFQAQGRSDFHLDHTLPNKYLWPLTTETATLLCGACNNAKHDKWPSEVYNEAQLRRLAVLTGFPYDLLSGEPKLSPDAVSRLVDSVDQFLIDWIRYPSEIKKVRELIRQMRGIDIRDHATTWPASLGS